MSSIKGYQSKQNPKPFEYATIENLGGKQYGLTVAAYTSYQNVSSDAAEAGSTSQAIVATSHVARAGDIIKVTSGTDSGYSSRVDSVEANLITLIDKFPAAIGNGDTFDILRPAFPIISSGGASSFSSAGKSVVTTVRNDYSSVNVTAGAWVQLVAALSASVTELEIFDSSGQTLELGTGAAASETRLILVVPGGNGRVPVAIASGARLSIRAVSATANVGELSMNIYGA